MAGYVHRTDPEALVDDFLLVPAKQSDASVVMPAMASARGNGPSIFAPVTTQPLFSSLFVVLLVVRSVQPDRAPLWWIDGVGQAGPGHLRLCRT